MEGEKLILFLLAVIEFENVVIELQKILFVLAVNFTQRYENDKKNVIKKLLTKCQINIVVKFNFGDVESFQYFVPYQNKGKSVIIIMFSLNFDSFDSEFLVSPHSSQTLYTIKPVFLLQKITAYFRYFFHRHVAKYVSMNVTLYMKNK